MSAALLPCPFCGAHARLIDCRTIWRVECSSIKCQVIVLGDRAPEPQGGPYPAGYWEAFEKSAIDRWNARPAIAPPVAAGSVDTAEFAELMQNVRHGLYAQSWPPLITYINAWGAQQREQGEYAAQSAAEDRICNLIAVLGDEKLRAEKAEADLKARDFFVDVLNCQVKKAQGEADVLFHRLNAANGHLAMARERIEELETEIKVLHQG